jgi:hypothetical protein
VEELAHEVEGRSVAGNLVAELINISTNIGKKKQIWNELVADNVLLNNIRNKITSHFQELVKKEEDEVKLVKSRRLEEKSCRRLLDI